MLKYGRIRKINCNKMCELILFLRNQSTNSLPKFEISRTSRSPTFWEGPPKSATNDGNIPIMRRKDIELRIAKL